MTITKHLQSYLESGQISRELEESLDNPAERHMLYKLLVNQPAPPYRHLLLRLLDNEIAFRMALWHGHMEGDGDSAEGIHHCAYLLSRCGEPADAKAIWKAQYLNQDVGELDVGNFVGAGVSETLAFLVNSNDEVSQEISQYILSSLSHPKASEWLDSWRATRHEFLANET